MDLILLKRQLDNLRASASQTTAIPSSVVFALTDPIMDDLQRKPSHHACCGFLASDGHNASCTFYGSDERANDKETDHG